MKIKTINRVIRKKMDEWIETIGDMELARRVRENAIVTGGCIASMLLREDVNDYDIYLADERTCYDLAVYYCGTMHLSKSDCLPIAGVVDMESVILGTSLYRETQKFHNQLGRVRCYIGSAGILREKNPVKEGEYGVLCITENAITLSDKIQIVTRFIGDPKTIHENYDFIHATNYWTYKTGLVVNEKALSSLLTRELFYAGSKYPLCSVIRTRKFINRKWSINAGQYLKMIMQLNALDLNDIDVLREQLTGVDSAYFTAVIDMMNREIKEHNKSHPDEEITTLSNERCMQIIDCIFDIAIGDEDENEG